jgi:LacI family transcriptional regulator
MKRNGSSSGAGSTDRSVTIRDVARQAHVSLASVSRVLSEHPDVSLEMQRRVLKAVESLDFEPDLLAQSLRRGVTHTIGFLIGDISNPVFADVIRGAEDYARSKGYGVMLTNSEADPSLDAEHLRLFLRRRVDGIMVSTTESGSADVASELIKQAVPYVVLDRDAPRNARVSTVFGDHASGTRDATAHLIDRGHQDIALISGSEDLRPARERIRGFREAFDAAGRKPTETLIRRGRLTPEFGREEALRLLNEVDRPSAIIAGSNRVLAGVLEGIHQTRYLVGRDLAVVGYDDLDLARLYRPPISVVVRDQYRMGQVACELLIERLTNPGAPIRSVTIPTQFVPRASSDFPWTTKSRGEVSDSAQPARLKAEE